ncbi:MAG: sialidase family protein [Planctomycetota bacterium]|jgi:hypothetical protein
MIKREKSPKVVLPALTGLLVFVFALHASGGEDLIEPKGGGEHVTRNPEAIQCPLIHKMHQLRRDGDHEALSEFRSLLPRGTASGESAGEKVLIPTHTVAGTGDLALMTRDKVRNGCPDGKLAAAFGGDIRIRSWNTDHQERHHIMASGSDGSLYVAWQDDQFDHDYIHVNKSGDGGKSWSGFGFVKNDFADLKEPSIAVGEGKGGDTLLLAYIMDDGSGFPVPEVATASLATHDFSVHSVPVWAHWEGYAKPTICTDAVHYAEWYAYLTCEGIFEAASNNVNVCSWNSDDGGVTWGNDQIVFGGSDTFEWSDPDIAYGTNMERVFIATHNYDDDTLYTVASDDYAATWNTSIAAATVPSSADYRVDPEIAAAVNHDHVMVCCTRFTGSPAGNHNINYTYSSDGGQNWTALYTMYDHKDYPEFAVALTANEGGGSWHLTYTSWIDQTVCYTSRPQGDLTEVWHLPMVVDDRRWAAIDPGITSKGIASGWSTDSACIAWADKRDLTWGDLDGFVDFIGNTGLMADETIIWGGTGGTTNFTLNAGPVNGGRKYILVGGISGCEPGMLLPGGHAILPVNYDLFTYLTMILANTPTFSDFIGVLDKSGMATATMNLPPFVIGGCYFSYYAFALNGPWDYASNPATIFLKD